ncbi:glycosyltransferase family 4 protein [Sodalis sp. RH24]
MFDERSFFHSFLKKIQHFVNYKILLAQNVIDVIVSPSYFLKEVFEIYGVKQKILVIRNPIDLADKINEENGNTADGYRFYEKGDSDNPIKIVFIGRVTPEKGLNKFISLLEKNTDKYYEVHIFGVGEDLSQITHREINTTKLTIIAHGFIPREHLPVLIRDYDLFVLPSLWVENAPISIIEAAKQGLPVLVPNYGGLKEMAELTKYFFFFDFENGSSLPNVIDMAIKRRKQNKILEEKIFSHELYKKKIKEIYTT